MDRPSEVLLSFLYRYGNVKGFDRSVDRDKVTKISQQTVLFSDGGEADLAPVYKVDKIVQLFGVCFLRLLKRVVESNLLEPSESEECLDDRVSLLNSIINGSDIQYERKKCYSKCLELDRLTKQASKISLNHPGKVTTGKRVGYVFSKDESKKSPKRLKGNNEKQSPKPHTPSKKKSNNVERKIFAFDHGPQRSNRGALIPKKRFDVEARNEEKKRNPSIGLLRRGSKNRKNKRKQSRDKALKEFADRELELMK